jgi:hypothetical protein
VPISVIMQTLDGKRFEEVWPLNAELNRWLPRFDDASYPLLRLIDPYGNTLFSSNQMLGFLPEWDRLSQNVTDDEARKLFERVRDIAELCKKKPHTFLRFVGD